MVSSQDTAIAVALAELGYDLPLRTEVLGVRGGSPADGKLEATRPTCSRSTARSIDDVAKVVEAIQRTGVDEQAEVRRTPRRERRTFG